MKLSIFSLVVFVLISVVMSCGCSNRETTRNTADSKISSHSDTLVFRQIASDFPAICFQITPTHIYIGNGRKIGCYDQSGSLKKEIVPPSPVSYFLDFQVTEEDSSTTICTVGDGIVTCFSDSGTIKYTHAVGDIFRISPENNLIYTAQTTTSEGHQAQNQLCEYNPKSNQTKIIKDIALSTFEIVDSTIMFQSTENLFHQLSLSDKNDSITNLGEWPEERVWFLGKANNCYVFKYFDYELKQDIISIYDFHLVFIKQIKLASRHNELHDVLSQMKNSGTQTRRELFTCTRKEISTA